MQALTSAIMFVDSDTGRQYIVRLIPENQLTDDPSRRFPVGPIGWRDGRLPFTFSDVEGDPHNEALHVGNLFNLRREELDGTMWVMADLDWDTDELAIEAKRLVDEDRITGVSITPTDLEAFLICGAPDNPTAESVRALAEQFDPETCPEDQWTEAWINVVIGSATLLMMPAFEDAEVVTAGVPIVTTADEIESDGKLADALIRKFGKWQSTDDGLTLDISQALAAVDAIEAAADLKRPPHPWFKKPVLDGPTYITVTDEGRVFGTLAPPDVCHRGYSTECVLPPPDAANFEEFHDNASVLLDDGTMLRVGCLTVDVGHADPRASSAAAKRHYDDSGTVVAFVRAGQDENGIWVAGALAPWATEEQIEKLKRLRVSGDWRPTKDGRHFLIAAQTVPVPGFPIRAKVASGFLAAYTTLSPANDYDPAPLSEVSDMALVATAVSGLADMIRDLRQQLDTERKQREYEKALSVFAEVV